MVDGTSRRLAWAPFCQGTNLYDRLLTDDEAARGKAAQEARDLAADAVVSRLVRAWSGFAGLGRCYGPVRFPSERAVRPQGSDPASCGLGSLAYRRRSVS